jgi:hypothetical protein
VWLGAPTKCGACGRTDIPFIPVGTVYPVTQWELSFSGFTRLLADLNGRSRINGLLGSWYGYTVAGHGEASTVQSSTGERIDPIALHERIQGNPENQYALYQMAMGLWR